MDFSAHTGGKGWRAIPTIKPNLRMVAPLRAEKASRGMFAIIVGGLLMVGMVVILGIFYFGQDERVRDEAAVVRAVDATVDWLLARGSGGTFVLRIANSAIWNSAQRAPK